MEPKEWGELWAAMKANPTQWIETTEKMEDEMLNVLPPRAFGPSCFLMGEPDHDDEHGRPTFACFRRRKVEGAFIHEARYLAVEQFPDEALRVEEPDDDDGSDLRCAYCGEKWPCANPGGTHMSIGELRARTRAADRKIAEAARPHTRLPQFPKAERYALLMREAFAHAHDRGRTDAGPLANAANLCRVLAHENKGSDPIAEAFWTRTLQWLEEG